MKRTIALLLAVLMVAALFIGCQKNDPAPTEGGSTPEATEKPAATEKKDIPTINWYLPGKEAPNQKTWNEKMNAYLEEKIGVHLDLHLIDYGEWGNRVNTMVAANEYYDICFANMDSYRKNVNMNAYADLTPYMDQVPALKEAIPQAVWDAATVNGSLFSVPTYKDVANAQYFLLEKNFADTYFPQYKDGMVEKIGDLTPAFEAYNAETGKRPVTTGGFNLPILHYDNLGIGLDGYGVDMFAEGAPKIVKVFHEDFMKETMATIQHWTSNGLMNDDGAVRKEISPYESVMSMGRGWPSAWINNEVPVYAVSFGVPVLTNRDCLGSLNCISVSSKYPLEALKLLEIVNTDPWVRDRFCYGEEGVNFDYVEENGEKKVHRINTDWGSANYTQGQFFIETPEEGTIGNPFVDEVLVNNEKAHKSPCLGFNPDTSEMEDKLDEMRGICKEFNRLINSTYSEEPIEQMYSRLDEVGAEEVIAELQRQLDEWWAAKNA